MAAGMVRAVRAAASAAVGLVGVGMVASGAGGAAGVRGAVGVGRATGAGAGQAALGGFLNEAKIAIFRQLHKDALTGPLWLAAHGDPQGIIATLRFGNRTQWIQANFNMLFAPNGPLSRYKALSSGVLRSHLKDTEKFARAVYNRDHFTNPSGANQEDIPAWTTLFFRYFESQSNHESTHQRTARRRVENRQISRSLI